MKTVLDEVSIERWRQEQLKRDGKFKYTCADMEPSNSAKLAILAEEFGEAAREVCEESKFGALDRLRTELIQVAAVAVAWAESLTNA